MRLHVLGLPHTRTEKSFSHCAFTQKVVKLIPMMRAQGFEVFHYGVGDVNPGADEHFTILGAATQEALLGHDHSNPTRFVGDDANVGNACYKEFNTRLATMLEQSVQSGDIVCLPFGHAHAEGIRTHKGVNVETGIGYPRSFADFRVYESNAWYAYHCGIERGRYIQRGEQGETYEGSDYHVVIPNYFDTADWDVPIDRPRKYLAFFGRICQIKGMDVIREIAKARPELDVIVCGQGDATPWLSAEWPNLKYLPPKTGLDRAHFLAGAIALLAPSRYIEPFCGVTVEANLCGTPALTSDFGAFHETIEPNFNGQRCRTLGDWLAAVEWAEQYVVPKRYEIGSTCVAVAEFARAHYSLEAIGPKYKQYFESIGDIVSGDKQGWYSRRTALTLSE